MMSFKLFLEKQGRNRLRKAKLVAQGVGPNFTSEEDLNRQADEWAQSVKDNTFNSDDELAIKARAQYVDYMVRKKDPFLASRFLQAKRDEFITTLKRHTITPDKYTKIYEKWGVQVFIDTRNVLEEYDEGSEMLDKVKSQVDVFLTSIKDILPNRKPKFIITNVARNLITRSWEDRLRPSAGIYFNRLIFIDEKSIINNNVNVWVHEYTHALVDMVPGSLQKMLFKAYNNILQTYYKKRHVRRMRMDSHTNDPVEVAMTEANRRKISNFLGFPHEYGLTNEHEFLSVIMEHWDQLHRSAATYKFKQIVKKIIGGL